MSNHKNKISAKNFGGLKTVLARKLLVVILSLGIFGCSAPSIPLISSEKKRPPVEINRPTFSEISSAQHYRGGVLRSEVHGAGNVGQRVFYRQELAVLAHGNALAIQKYIANRITELLFDTASNASLVEQKKIILSLAESVKVAHNSPSQDAVILYHVRHGKYKQLLSEGITVGLLYPLNTDNTYMVVYLTLEDSASSGIVDGVADKISMYIDTNTSEWGAAKFDCWGAEPNRLFDVEPLYHYRGRFVVSANDVFKEAISDLDKAVYGELTGNILAQAQKTTPNGIVFEGDVPLYVRNEKDVPHCTRLPHAEYAPVVNELKQESFLKLPNPFN